MYGPLRLHCVSFPPPFPLRLKRWVSSSPCPRLKRWVSSSSTLFTNDDRSVIYAQHPREGNPSHARYPLQEAVRLLGEAR